MRIVHMIAYIYIYIYWLPCTPGWLRRNIWSRGTVYTCVYHISVGIPWNYSLFMEHDVKPLYGCANQTKWLLLGLMGWHSNKTWGEYAPGWDSVGWPGSSKETQQLNLALSNSLPSGILDIPHSRKRRTSGDHLEGCDMENNPALTWNDIHSLIVLGVRDVSLDNQNMFFEKKMLKVFNTAYIFTSHWFKQKYNSNSNCA